MKAVITVAMFCAVISLQSYGLLVALGQEQAPAISGSSAMARPVATMRSPVVLSESNLSAEQQRSSARQLGLGS